LNVPSISYRNHVGGVHLWYIVDDVEELYRLLTHDINKWGQFQTLVDIGSADGLNRESPTFLRAAAAARLLQNLFHYCRQGRGEPVDRAILEASDAVSDTFLDEVDELSQLLDGNAQRLIAELRDGRIQRVRDARIDDLENYL
jgi:hypothetical protein